ncbi:MAG: hypothetical protein ABI824_07670 [Acidobacteriota bacterium]
MRISGWIIASGCVGTAVLVLMALGSQSRVPAQSSEPTVVPPMLDRPLSASAKAFVATTGLAFYHEFFGAGAYLGPEPAYHLQNGWANGLTLEPPVQSGMAQLTSRYDAGLMLRMSGTPTLAGLSANSLEQQRTAFQLLANSDLTHEFLWDLMPEWDQSGGAWVPKGRPQYGSMTKVAAHDTFLNYYRTSYPTLINYLQQTSSSGNTLLTAINDYSPNTFYAYELGVDLCLLERGIDELGDISTGIAFLRGAGNQYGRPWGIDLSTWRTSTNMATTYNSSGTLLGGWSASYLRRHYYASYMAGASVIQNEASTYLYATGELNPFGAATQEFADFSLHRHPDVGTPVVPTAFLVDHYGGFDPKHGVFNQMNAVWYQDMAYSSGDYMMDDVLRLAYPNHWLHGLAPGAPFADSTGVPNTSAFRNYLASGGDPRPYEPMPQTRWGDTVNIITTAASSNALQQYKVIVMVGDVTLDSRLRGDLQNWVSQGGILLMNASQSTADDENLLGATVQRNSFKSGSSSTWLSNGVRQTESAYRYRLATPNAATVLAANDAGDPLVTQNNVGSGSVLLSTPDYLQTTGRQLVLVGTQLLDSLATRYVPARVSGPALKYLINQTSNTLMVTLINSSGSDWSGDVVAARPSGSFNVSEYTLDQSAGYELTRTNLLVHALVPAYDVRVYAVEYGNPTTASPSSPAPVTARRDRAR